MPFRFLQGPPGRVSSQNRCHFQPSSYCPPLAHNLNCNTLHYSLEDIDLYSAQLFAVVNLSMAAFNPPPKYRRSRPLRSHIALQVSRQLQQWLNLEKGMGEPVLI